MYNFKNLGNNFFQSSNNPEKKIENFYYYLKNYYVDKIDLDGFVEALARFGDIRTHDGMVSLPKRLNAFFSNVVLQKARHRTDIAALWL